MKFSCCEEINLSSFVVKGGEFLDKWRKPILCKCGKPMKLLDQPTDYSRVNFGTYSSKTREKRIEYIKKTANDPKHPITKREREFKAHITRND